MTLSSSKSVLYIIYAFENRSLLQKYAFYILSGPWGRLWCRFGYDPRRDRESLPYQSIGVSFLRHSLIPERQRLKCAAVNAAEPSPMRFGGAVGEAWKYRPGKTDTYIIYALLRGVPYIIYAPLLQARYQRFVRCGTVSAISPCERRSSTSGLDTNPPLMQSTAGCPLMQQILSDPRSRRMSPRRRNHRNTTSR
jgi:hypothetical protein